MMLNHATQDAAQTDVSMVECSFSGPWSIRNDAIWVAEHMRRRHLLLREEELAECSSGLCVLMMGLKWATENTERLHFEVHFDEHSRDTSRDSRRSLVVPKFDRLMLCTRAVRSTCNPKWSNARTLGVIARAGIGVLHRACEVGDIGSVAEQHRAVESDPLWGLALQLNREHNAIAA